MVTLTKLVSSNGLNGPAGNLIADAAGDLFGTTGQGGGNNGGTVFEIAETSPGYASMPTTLISFNGSDGDPPFSGQTSSARQKRAGRTAMARCFR